MRFRLEGLLDIPHNDNFVPVPPENLNFRAIVKASKEFQELKFEKNANKRIVELLKHKVMINGVSVEYSDEVVNSVPETDEDASTQADMDAGAYKFFVTELFHKAMGWYNSDSKKSKLPTYAIVSASTSADGGEQEQEQEKEQEAEKEQEKELEPDEPDVEWLDDHTFDWRFDPCWGLPEATYSRESVNHAAGEDGEDNFEYALPGDRWKTRQQKSCYVTVRKADGSQPEDDGNQKLAHAAFNCAEKPDSCQRYFSSGPFLDGLRDINGDHFKKVSYSDSFTLLHGAVGKEKMRRAEPVFKGLVWLVENKIPSVLGGYRYIRNADPSLLEEYKEMEDLENPEEKPPVDPKKPNEPPGDVDEEQEPEQDDEVPEARGSLFFSRDIQRTLKSDAIFTNEPKTYAKYLLSETRLPMHFLLVIRPAPLSLQNKEIKKSRFAIYELQRWTHAVAISLREAQRFFHVIQFNYEKKQQEIRDWWTNHKNEVPKKTEKWSESPPLNNANTFDLDMETEKDGKPVSVLLDTDLKPLEVKGKFQVFGNSYESMYFVFGKLFRMNDSIQRPV
jgi:hypothetical protein